MLPGRRRDRQGHPPDAGRQGREREARGLVQLSSSDILVIGGGIAGLSARPRSPPCQGHRSRGRGGDRLPFVRPQRDDAPLCARRSAGPGADARQPAFFEAPPAGFHRRAARPSHAGPDPCPRGRACRARPARCRRLRRSRSSSGSMRTACSSSALRSALAKAARSRAWSTATASGSIRSACCKAMSRALRHTGGEIVTDARVSGHPARGRRLDRHDRARADTSPRQS